MKKLILLIATILVFTRLSAQTSLFNDLLQAHVTKDGIVDYASFNNEKLDAYLSYLEKTAPEASWSDNKQKAFWINAYNAYTIKKILESYPLKSITDIKENGKTVWKIPFAKVGGETYTLDYVEHEILRKKLFDPRIHVGLNCAANSCPKLENVAFTERNIEATLENLMKTFINDTTSNKIAKHNIQISSIFNWFQKDFTRSNTLISYLNKYSETKINSDSKISYLKYDWSLNGK
jgi:hypothetical protein